ncbi:unnamed protein product [Rhizoctonia solani]|uniref:Uncharacterized protein n=1 Tax=Rhizoctonia solani TaxID=456999 RepID=A0A8H3C4C2_9AGAM|nr:unnamed protein product [Rhizoctonia solani]
MVISLHVELKDRKQIASTLNSTPTDRREDNSFRRRQDFHAGMRSLAGVYGLRNKRGIWHISLVLSNTRRAARDPLKLGDKDPTCLFEGKLWPYSLHFSHTHHHIDFGLTSPCGGGRKGRVHHWHKRAVAAANKNAGGDEAE